MSFQVAGGRSLCQEGPFTRQVQTQRIRLWSAVMNFAPRFPGFSRACHPLSIPRRVSNCQELSMYISLCPLRQIGKKTFLDTASPRIVDGLPISDKVVRSPRTAWPLTPSQSPVRSPTTDDHGDIDNTDRSDHITHGQLWSTAVRDCFRVKATDFTRVGVVLSRLFIASRPLFRSLD